MNRFLHEHKVNQQLRIVLNKCQFDSIQMDLQLVMVNYVKLRIIESLWNISNVVKYHLNFEVSQPVVDKSKYVNPIE